ncbi:hypothetical protein Rsub_01712 [Raphidocelis subcapitata]|uniref:Uncharacterized protein n=1 Tax=Raphidocelis subcapitata TaxID=307507 RepID=A0A2V0NMQ8_9CHLO|nr:hypothetical protein Rsub_01712 [Raphidocelis subcapitata]|eukprot:GBF88811.1 hypothetical protein Rsub_01712 [Raphidocelis subcapitata]
MAIRDGRRGEPAGNGPEKLLTPPGKAAAYTVPRPPGPPWRGAADIGACHRLLASVDRDAAACARHLPPSLRDAAALLHLALLGARAIASDATLPLDARVTALRGYHEWILWGPPRASRGSAGAGRGPSSRLLSRFGPVAASLRRLEPGLATVVAGAARRSGCGAAELLAHGAEPVASVADFNRWCHFTGGAEVTALSQMLAVTGLEAAWFASAHAVADEAGLFLRKIESIRAVAEDLRRAGGPRVSWPEAVWGRAFGAPQSMLEPSRRADAVACLNEMATDGLTHIPACLSFLEGLSRADTFAAVAAPMVAALAGYVDAYGDGRVFEGGAAARPRPGLVARALSEVASYVDCLCWFVALLEALALKVAEAQAGGADPCADAAATTVAAMLTLCRKKLAAEEEWEDTEVPGVTCRCW